MILSQEFRFRNEEEEEEEAEVICGDWVKLKFLMKVKFEVNLLKLGLVRKVFIPETLIGGDSFLFPATFGKKVMFRPMGADIKKIL